MLLLSAAPLTAWIAYETVLWVRGPGARVEQSAVELVVEALWLPLLWTFLVGVVTLALAVSGIGTGSPASVRIAAPRSSDLRTAVAVSVLGSLVAAAFDFALPGSDNPDVPSVAVRLLYWVILGLVVGLLLGLDVGFVRGGRRAVLRGSPKSLWRHDVLATPSAAVAFTLTSWGVCVFVNITSDWRDADLGSLPSMGGLLQDVLDWSVLLVLLSMAWLIAATAASEVGRYAVANTLLWVRRRGPLRLLRFLEDARERQIIRRAGTVYEFRHARLQSRLAQGSAVRAQSASKRGAGEPSVSTEAAGSAR